MMENWFTTTVIYFLLIYVCKTEKGWVTFCSTEALFIPEVFGKYRKYLRENKRIQDKTDIFASLYNSEVVILGEQVM